MRIDVVAATLGVVFENKDCSVVPVGGVADKIGNFSDGVIIISNLQRRCVQPGDGGAFVTEVNVGQAQQSEIGQTVREDIALPFVKQIRVRIVLVKAPEKQVGLVMQLGFEGDSLRHVRSKWRG